MVFNNQNQSYDRTFQASPQFLWRNSSLVVGASDVVSWETYNTASQKYLPFNQTRIVNNGEDDIWFYPNQDLNNPIFVAKGTIISIDERTVPALRSFKITHAGSTSTISANKIIITNSRSGQNADSIVQRLHSNLFNKLKKGLV